MTDYSIPTRSVAFSLTADGSTGWQSDHDGELFIQAAGTFGGGTLTIEVRLSDGTTVQSLESASFTSGPVSKRVQVSRSNAVRVTLSGATAPSIAGEILPV